MTKQELIKLINDLPDSITVLVQYDDSYWALRDPGDAILHKLESKDYTELRLHLINTKDSPRT